MKLRMLAVVVMLIGLASGFKALSAFTTINVPFYPVGKLFLTGTTPPGNTIGLNRTLYFTFAGGSSDSGNSSYSSEGYSTLGTDKIIIGWEAYSQTPVTSQVSVTFIDATQLSAAGKTPDSDYSTWPEPLKNITCNIETGSDHCSSPGFDSFDTSWAATILGSDEMQVRITANQTNLYGSYHQVASYN